MAFQSNNNIDEKVQSLINNNIKITPFLYYHGTFSSKSIKIITDVDITQYYEIKQKDIKFGDICSINSKKANELVKTIQDNLTNIKSKKNIFFNSLLAGYDERFLFDFMVLKNGKILNYNPNDIRKRFKDLLKNKVLTKDEFESLDSRIKDNPTLVEFFTFFNKLESFFKLTWTYDEIMKNEKTIRSKSFNLNNTFRNYNTCFCLGENPLVFTFVVLIGDIYLDVDSTLIYFYFKNNNKNKNNKLNQSYFDKSKDLVFINERDRADPIRLYHGMFFNFVKGKYFKMFKRLRTIINRQSRDFNNVNNRKKRIIMKLSYDSKGILNKDYTIINQIKNRIDALLILKEHLTNTQMLKFIKELIEYCMSLNFIDEELMIDIIKGKKINYEKLEILKNELFDYLNNKARNVFIEYYRRARDLINFHIKEFDELEPDKTFDFSTKVSCDSFYKNLQPNKKYKFFRSHFKYALDWDQCKFLIPMGEKPVINMLKYMFFKFKSGIFVEVKNNKISKYIPFYNLNFKNNWSSKITTDIKNINSKKLRRLETNKTKWTAMNCTIKLNDINDTNEKALFELHDMLTYTLNNNVVKDCNFFINTKDFPLLSKNGYEPYEYLWGNKVPLTSCNFDEYSPLFSFCNKNDEFLDHYLPTDHCWQTVTKEFYPPSCENNFLPKDLLPWSKKKDTLVWRGASTGCESGLTNPRILISKINQDWSNNSKLKGLLNAGLTKATMKYKLKNGELTKVNLDKLNIKLLEPIPMHEQFSYKYLLDIEGNAAAYRLGYFLSSKSTLFKVDSPYTIWINEFLESKKHYLPITRDYSNLSITIEWARKHDTACKKIADNAYKIFTKCYNKDFIGKYISDKLNKL